MDIVTENCTELIRYQKLPRTHHFATFHEELLRLSAHFHVSRIFYVYHLAHQFRNHEYVTIQDLDHSK